MRFSDTFSGLGGWTQGGKRAGLVPVDAANHWDVACDYHHRNHPEGNVPICQDVAEIDFARLESVPIWCASPACQGFSSGGAPARKGTGGNGHVNISEAMLRTKGQRATPMAVLNIASYARPEVILVENVKEMLGWSFTQGSKDGSAFRGWVQYLTTAGYHVEHQVVNARDFGCAQDRERLVISASLRGPLVLPTRGPKRLMPYTIAGALDGDGAPGNRWALIDDKPERTRNLIRDRQELDKLDRGLLNNVGDGVRMRPLSDVAPTLTTQSGTQLMLIDGDRVRILNPMECARLQGWRDDENLQLPSQRKLASKLIGNAIPVPMAATFLAHAKAHLEN